LHDRQNQNAEASSKYSDDLTQQWQEMHKRESNIWATYQECQDRATVDFKNQPRGEWAEIVLGVDLATIALGWLIVWGCVAVVRWVHRGFVAP
jgi:hypothetical protein